MSKPYPWYFVIDGNPVKVAAKDEVLAMDPSTGAMVPSASYQDRLSSGEVDKATYMELLDKVRQPILERYATAPLQWESTGDSDEPFRITVDGHVLTIRMGDFPDEALYLMHIDGRGTYAIDDWPNAWKKPA
jgi:hypothetical protein